MDEVSVLKPKAIENIGYWEYMQKNSKIYYSLGNKEIDRYIRVPEEKLTPIMEVIRLFNGNNEIRYIENYLRENRKINIDVYSLYKLLAKVGLIEGCVPEQVNGELSVMGLELLSLNFPSINNFMRTSAKYILIMWKFLFIVSAVMIFLGLILKSDRTVYLIDHAFVVNNSHILGLVWTMLFCFISSLFHELMHWCFAIKNGLKPDRFKMVLYSGIIPIMYVKINGLYTLDKKKRIEVMAAGMLTNLLICLIGISIILWGNTQGNTDDIIMKLVLSNGYMAITNLTPFTITDGYYIFCWTFGIVNMRINILKTLKRLRNGEKTTISNIMAIYSIISIILIILAMYSSFIWFYNIVNECFNIFDISIPRYISLILSLSIIGVTMSNIILKFKRFMNS